MDIPTMFEPHLMATDGESIVSFFLIPGYFPALIPYPFSSEGTEVKRKFWKILLNLEKYR
jgi:hypothetical protein